jgi:xanthine dehydrogenase small subunit
MQVRDAGTIAGNIANGSPIGDMPPVLIALGARIRLRRGSRVREMALEEFFIAYGKQNREPGDVLTHVIVPRPARDALFAAEKISKRVEQDISAVSAGFYVRMEQGVVADVRLAFGGMAGTPKRAAKAEAALLGQRWGESAVHAAMDRLAEDFSPLSDWRGSADYRLASAQGLLQRFWREHSGSRASKRLGELAGIGHG